MDIEIKVSDDGFQAQHRLADISFTLCPRLESQ